MLPIFLVFCVVFFVLVVFILCLLLRMLNVFRHGPFMIVPSIFYNVYLIKNEYQDNRVRGCENSIIIIVNNTTNRKLTTLTVYTVYFESITLLNVNNIQYVDDMVNNFNQNVIMLKVIEL